MGVEAHQYGSLVLVPVLLSKVLPELRLIISREFDTGNWSLDELLKVLKFSKRKLKPGKGVTQWQ